MNEIGVLVLVRANDILAAMIFCLVLFSVPRSAHAEGYGVPDPRSSGNVHLRTMIHAPQTGVYEDYDRYLVLGRVWSGTQYLGLIGAHAVADGRQDMSFGMGLGGGFIGSANGSNPRVLRDYTNGTRIFDFAWANASGNGYDNLCTVAVEDINIPGSYIVGCRGMLSSGFYEVYLVKFDRFGNLDTSFGTNGIVTTGWQTSSNHAFVRALVFKPAGANTNLYVIGAVGTYAGGFQPYVQIFQSDSGSASSVITNPSCTVPTTWSEDISANVTPVAAVGDDPNAKIWIALSEWKFDSGTGNRKSYAWTLLAGGSFDCGSMAPMSHPFTSTETNLSSVGNDTVLAGVVKESISDTGGSPRIHFVGAARSHSIGPEVVGPYHCFMAHTNRNLDYIGSGPGNQDNWGFTHLSGLNSTDFDGRGASLFNPDVTSPEGPRYDCILNDIVVADSGSNTVKLLVGGAAYNRGALAGPANGAITTVQEGNYEFFTATINHEATSLRHISMGPEGAGDDVINKVAFLSGTLTAEDFYALGRTANLSNFAGSQSLKIENKEDWFATTTTGAPAGRAEHSYVWTGQKLVVWGGRDADAPSYPADGGIYDPISDTWAAVETTSAPAARYGTPAVWTGSEMILWGGNDSSMNGIQAGYKLTFSSSDTNGTWSATATSTDEPSARRRHSMNFSDTDTSGNRYVIIFGGENGAGAKDDGGVYNLRDNSWTKINSGSFDARVSHTGVWDTGQKKLFLWGGLSSGFPYNNCTYFNPRDMTFSPRTAGGTARGYAAAAFDGRRILLFGGWDASSELADGDRYDTITDSWSTMNATNKPSARMAMNGVWNGAAFFVWGGQSGGTWPTLGASYNPTLDVWTPMSTTGVPAGVSDAAAVWTGERYLVWGGYNGYGRNTGGQYSPGNVILHPDRDVWTLTSTSGSPAPPRTSRHSAVWTGKEMIIWGGIDQTASVTYMGYRYEPISQTWALTDSVGTDVPVARKNHSAVWTGSEMIVWGGSDNTSEGGNDSTELSDGSRYDPGSDVWTAVSMTNAPSARELHTAVWAYSGTDAASWNGKMVIWGGTDDEVTKSDGKYYRPDNNSWTTLAISGKLTQGRYGHAMWFDGKNIGIWGGNRTNKTSPTLVNTGAMLDLAANSVWVAISSSGAPTARTTSSVWTGRHVVMFGEKSNDHTSIPFCSGSGATAANRGARFDPFTGTGGTWLTMSTTDMPNCINEPMVAWTGSKVIYWGGQNGSSGDIQDYGGIYDPIYNVWTALSASGVAARIFGTGLWTGKDFMMFGGSADGAYSNNFDYGPVYHR